MDTPGMSIFQGSEDIRVNSTLDRLEEEEALEDQRRRNEELGNQLQTAFDDLIDDDDEYSVDSTNYQSHNVPHNPSSEQIGFYKPHHVAEVGQGDHNKFNMEIEKLKTTIESKNREIDNISKLVHEERKKNDELGKRLALSEAERERANMSRTQTHELLVESKAKISDLEDNISKLKTKIKTLETSNNDLVGEMERTKMQLSDAQHKYHLVERNAGYSADRHAETLIKQANERHVAQVEMMQQQIQSLRDKLDTKETEYNALDARYKELQRNREALLLEKSEVINQLARNLEDSQRHCQELMAKTDHTQENIKLQRLVKGLEQQTNDMQKTINNLTNRLDATQAELDLMDGVLGENEDISESLRRLSMTKGNFVGSTPLPTNDRVARLKSELYRSMAGQKEKREEIRKLQEQIASKNEEIKKLKDDENKALIQMNTCKEENTRLENRLRITESEFIKLKRSNDNGNKEKTLRDELEQEIIKLKKKNDLLEQELRNSRTEYEIYKEKSEQLKTEIEILYSKLKITENYEMERRNLATQLKNLNVDLEEIKQEHENLKRNYENVMKENENLRQNDSAELLKIDLEKHKFLLKDAQNECDRLKNLYVEISNAKEALSADLLKIKSSDLSKELHEQKEMCSNLKKAVKLAELKCAEFVKLVEAQKQSHQNDITKLKEIIEKNKAKAEKLNKDATNDCTKCVEQLTQLAKLEVEILKLQNQCSTYIKEIDNLENQLRDAKETIADMNEKCDLKEERDQLIAELKEKAQQFEEYIKQQSNSSKDTSGVCSPKKHSYQDRSVETSPELEHNYNYRKIESKLRDEMAKIYADKIRESEEHFKDEFKKLTEIHKTDIKTVIIELQNRNKEVEILKHAILAEREIMEKKIIEYQRTVTELDGILQKCREQLQRKEKSIEMLEKELMERSAQIDSERKSMKAVMSQWEDHRSLLAEKERQYKIQIEQANARYESAMRTSANYKRYADDKERHMLSEYERLQSEFSASILRHQKEMKHSLDKNTKQIIEKTNQLEELYGTSDTKRLDS